MGDTMMFESTLKKIFGTKNDREMKVVYRPVVDKINALEPSMEALSDEKLQGKTQEFRDRLKNGETLDGIMVEAFAVCREASKRVLGMRPYDVQLIGGMVLHQGNIAEMRTGEGKTLVATLPVYLNALNGEGVHVVTVNDYLAKRDAAWMGEVYRWLGLSVGVIVHDLSDQERKEAYGYDITYATNNELGFDHLRDNMKYELGDYVQRPPNFAIVDECDSILIDEARTPLIISGPSEDQVDKYYKINKIIPHLKKETHFTMEEKNRSVALTEEGNTKVEELLEVGNIYDPQNLNLVHHIYQGLKAHHLFRLDVDYMVREGEIVIVDEFTGRLMTGRRWSDGLHQAVEAKEGVDVKSENQTLASITFQNYFRMYKKLAGMTGTAETEAVEFKKIYSLDVWVVPTNQPIARLDENDVVYKTNAAKYKAIAQDIREAHSKGQPVLVGTVSIERSEAISRALKQEGVHHNVLNAKHHEKEADIVAQAGRKGSVTIATNMAGRGTDIVLGGNPEFLAKSMVSEENEKAFQESLLKHQKICEDEKADVLSAGGLYIIGTERHESRRIDNQLRGRSGRQGDPGRSKFYLSLEDDLMRIFNGERIQKIMNTLNVPDDEPITAKMVTRSIEGAQRKVEGHNFDIRKHLLEYDDVMNEQRKAIYQMRRNVLEGGDFERVILNFLGDATSDILDTYANENVKKSEWDIKGLQTALMQQFGLNIDFGEVSNLTADGLTEKVSSSVKELYDKQKSSLGEHLKDIQRMILLQTLDNLWKEHLQFIDHLKEGINLRGYAQKDPLVEYKKEAFIAFEKLNRKIKAATIEKLIRVRLVTPEIDPSVFDVGGEVDANKFSYHGGEDQANDKGKMPYPMLSAQQDMAGSQHLGRQGGDESHRGDSHRKENRAERRRRERAQKKQRR